MLLSASRDYCCDMPWWFVGAEDGKQDRRSIARPIKMTHHPVMDSLRLSIRAALAAGLAVAIAQSVGLPFPIYAMIAAVIVTDVSAARTRQLALPRFAGTVVGATLGAAINPLLQPAAWGVGLGIFAAMFITHLLRLPAAARVAGYVCGIVVLSNGDDRWFYALHRTVETIVGIGLAVVVSLVPPLIPLEESSQQARASQEKRSQT